MNPIVRMRLRFLALMMVMGLGTPALAAPANAYDKFRDAKYSNSGLMSEQDEIRLGRQAHEQVLQKYRLVQDPEIAGYVERLGSRIAASSLRPNLQYHFFVVDDSAVNAFSLPGGFVYVNAGLLNLVQNEDELSAVIGHEIGHVVARHGLRNYKKAQKTQIAAGVVGILAGVAMGNASGGRAAGAAAQIIGAGVLTRNSREFEREADYLGLYNMQRAGFRPAGMVAVFQRLGQAQGASKSSMGGIFADHPDSGERVKNTVAEIEQHVGGSAGVQYASAAASAGTYTNAKYDGARARRAGTNGGSSGAGVATSSAEFQAMKQALGSYRAGNRTARRDRGYDPYGSQGGRGNDPNDPYNQTNDPYGRGNGQDGGSNDPSNQRPVLRRRPTQP